MKLTKKITFKRAKNLPEFRTIEEKFNEIKGKEDNKGIARLNSVSNLNFYIVVEYVNLVDKIDYSKIFPNDNLIVDFEALMNEQERIMEYMQKKKTNSFPAFNKLGLTNDVTGCYLIATRKNIQSISKKNTSNTISVKFMANSFPNEVDSICEEFYYDKKETIKKEQDEFDKFLHLSFEEQDIILQNILQNIQLPTITFYTIPASAETNMREIKMNKYIPIKIEDIALQNIEKINSIEFLSNLLANAEVAENYELCAKIRDRMCFVENK